MSDSPYHGNDPVVIDTLIENQARPGRCESLHPLHADVHCMGDDVHPGVHWYGEHPETPCVMEWDDEGRSW